MYLTGAGLAEAGKGDRGLWLLRNLQVARCRALNYPHITKASDGLQGPGLRLPLPPTNLHNTAVHHGVQPLDVGLDGRLLLQQVVKLLVHYQTEESPHLTALGLNRDAS